MPRVFRSANVRMLRGSLNDKTEAFVIKHLGVGPSGSCYVTQVSSVLCIHKR